MRRERVWPAFALRWFIVGTLTLITTAFVFFIAEQTLQPTLAWLSPRLTFKGAADLVKKIEDIGPAGLAGFGALLMIRSCTPWANAALKRRPTRTANEGGPNSRGDDSASVAVSQPQDPGLTARAGSARTAAWILLGLLCVAVPLAATIEVSTDPAPPKIAAAALCLLTGGVIGTFLAIRSVRATERWLASTVGSIWRGGVADLRGTWRSTYGYMSKSQSKVAVQLMLLTQFGRTIYGRNIGGTSSHRHAIRMRVNGDFVTGEWRNTMPNARHRGVLQLRVKANGEEMEGKWIGFDSAANIQEGPWSWERM